MPYRKLFLSRWSALIWAAGILWTAADVADSSTAAPPADAVASGANVATGNPDMDRDIARFANVMGND